MTFDAANLNLLEKLRDFRVALSLLAFAALLDVFLLLTTGANLWSFKWDEAASRPGPWLLLVLAYSVTMTVGAGLLSWIAMTVRELFLPKLQRWLGGGEVPQNPNPQRYLTRLEAENALANLVDDARPRAVEAQLAERAAEIEKWHALVGAGWVGVALVMLDWRLDGSAVLALVAWKPWSPWLVLGIPALPCVYDLWYGVPGHDLVEWPRLAKIQTLNNPGTSVAMPSK